jgi:Na+/melibiose symporter-like transporter
MDSGGGLYITIAALFFYPLTKEKEQKMVQELAEQLEIAA